MTNTKIGNKRNKKIRDINAGVPLLEYVDGINSEKIKEFEVKEVDLNKFNNAELKAEREHRDFKIEQLYKNGIPTWFGKLISYLKRSFLHGSLNFIQLHALFAMKKMEKEHFSLSDRKIAVSKDRPLQDMLSVIMDGLNEKLDLEKERRTMLTSLQKD